MFFEHFAISGRHDYLEYTQRCRVNLQSSMERLPLLLPANLDTVAALTLGVCSLRATLYTDQSLIWSGFQRYRELGDLKSLDAHIGCLEPLPHLGLSQIPKPETGRRGDKSYPRTPVLDSLQTRQKPLFSTWALVKLS